MTKPLTKQDVLDIVSEHLFAQNERAVISKQDTGTYVCAYRGTTKGTRCAIGCMIPDALYSPDLENRAVKRLLAQFPKIAALFDLSDECDPVAIDNGLRMTDMLEDLQKMHDTGVMVYWGRNLCRIARQFGLSDKVPMALFMNKVEG